MTILELIERPAGHIPPARPAARRAGRVELARLVARTGVLLGLGCAFAAVILGLG